MKQARFITHPLLPGTVAPPAGNMNKNNAYSLPLLPGKGLLTVKKQFSLPKGAKVRLSVSALGIFQLYLNGKSITNADGSRDRLRPGWTDYHQRAFYYEYELSSYCKEVNLLVAQIAPGWFASRISYGVYGWNPPAFAAELLITLPGGETELLFTDPSWDTALCGPVLTSDLWDGEYYDASLPKPWESPGAYSWEKAVLAPFSPRELTPPRGEPIRIREELSLSPQSATLYEGDDGKAICVKALRRGTCCEEGKLLPGQGLILDFAQEIAGIPHFRLKAQKGTRIELFCAELLNDSGEKQRGNDGPAGSLYLANYRSALSRLVYIASGENVEDFRPDFCFYGFRYLELRCDAPVELLSLQGEVLSSVQRETARFICSDPEVNRLYENALWGLRSNYLSIPTDCPQRDERLGWTGDTQIFYPAATYLCHTLPFMDKWLQDCRDSQIGHDGGYSNIVPRVFTKPRHSAAAAWADAGILVPHRLWQMTGDTRILTEHYPSMEAYMEKLSRLYEENQCGPIPTYGDWLAYAPTDPKYISLCYYAQDARLMAEMSGISGKPERERHYRALFTSLREEWESLYVQNGLLTQDSQTAYLLALAFELAPQALLPAFCKRLRTLIEENGNRLSTGFVGTGILAPTLSKLGMDDLAYTLLFQRENPSWLYTVRQGATTMWERWNSYTKESGFGDVGMNSFNHYAYGAVVQWFFEGICGILPAAPGFASLLLSPTPDSPKRSEHFLRHAHASFDSPRGTVESGWAYEEGSLCYRFTVPAHTPTTLSLPYEGTSLTVNGLSHTPDSLSATVEKGRISFPLSPGKHEIRIPC